MVPKNLIERSVVRAWRPRTQSTIFSVHVAAQPTATEIEILTELHELCLFFDARPCSDRYEWILVGPVEAEPWLDHLLYHLRRIDLPVRMLDRQTAKKPNDGGMPPLKVLRE